MSDVWLSVVISRDLLGLPALEIAHGEKFYCQPQFMGAQVAYDREQAGSRYVEGSLTTMRRRTVVTEQIGVEVKGDTLAEVKANMEELVSAITQDTFTLTVITDDATWGPYQGEASDYQNAIWSPSRLNSAQGQLVFSMPRQPVPLSGVI